MGWSCASHFSHVSASPPGGSPGRHFRKVRSSNGGWHGVAGWSCFRGFPEAGAGLRADDGADSVSDAGSSLAATDLCLAELRSVSEISEVEGFPRFLGGEAGRPVVLGHRGALQADQASRAARRRRRFPAALIAPQSANCANLSERKRKGRTPMAKKQGRKPKKTSSKTSGSRAAAKTAALKKSPARK